MTFTQNVYTLCKKIPKGKVTTYKEIAKALKTKAYRQVGQALKKNPDAPKTPCHRVVKTNGELGGYHGVLNSKRKINLLRSEGVTIKNGKVEEFEKKVFRFR